MSPMRFTRPMRLSRSSLPAFASSPFVPSLPVRPLPPMTNRRRLSLLTALVVASSLAGAPAARADNYEARLGTRPVFGLALLEEEGATRDELGLAGGAALGFAYGVTNRLDLGAELVALSTLMPTFDAAIMSNGFIARGDFRRRSGTTLLLLGPSWRFGAQGWTPVVSAGLGGGVRLRSRGSFSRTGLVPDDKVELAALDLAVSAKVGLERRLDRRWTFGVYGAALGAWSTRAPLLPIASLSFGLSYVYYPQIR